MSAIDPAFISPGPELFLRAIVYFNNRDTSEKSMDSTVKIINI